PRVGGVPERRHGVGLRMEPLQVIDEPVPAVLRVLVVLAHVDGLFGADFLAVAAEDAAEFVDLVDQRVPVPVLVFPRHQLDAVGGTDLGAEAAGHALGAPLLVGEHPVRAAPPGRERPGAAHVTGALLFRILHRHLRLEHVLEGEREPLERGAYVAHLPLGALQDLDADGHQPVTGARGRPARVESAAACAATLRRRASEPETMSPLSRTRKSRNARMTLSPKSQRACIRRSVTPSGPSRTHTAVAVSMMYASATGSMTF